MKALIESVCCLPAHRWARIGSSLDTLHAMAPPVNPNWDHMTPILDPDRYTYTDGYLIPKPNLFNILGRVKCPNSRHFLRLSKITFYSETRKKRNTHHIF